MKVKKTSSANGVKCTWKGKVTNSYGPTKMEWNFSWDDLKKDSIDGLYGTITVRSSSGYFQPVNVDVDSTKTPHASVLITHGQVSSYNFVFDYSLTLYHEDPIETISYENLFGPSEDHDSILIVEGKKCHVNKAFLSYQSNYFRSLFSANFKEGRMTEIPIEEVSYEDFGLLMSSSYPDPVFPNDKTVEILLEMADRFELPSVIKIVEYHLIHNSRISKEKKLWMADRYIMRNLLKKTIREINSVDVAKALDASPEYQKLSDGTKAKILDRVMKLI